jgi:hypothetical protein
VNVTILNTQTGVRTDVVTNEAGIYDALSILPGNYTIAFGKEGFSKLVRQGIDLSIQIITVDAQLAMGTSSQTVEVTAQASLLKTESSEQGATLQSNVIAQLPNVGQNWTNFTQTLAGVTGTGVNISVNGAQHYEMGFYADGGNVILPRSNNNTVAERPSSTRSARAAPTGSTGRRTNTIRTISSTRGAFSRRKLVGHGGTITAAPSAGRF